MRLPCDVRDNEAQYQVDSDHDDDLHIPATETSLDDEKCTEQTEDCSRGSQNARRGCHEEHGNRTAETAQHVESEEPPPPQRHLHGWSDHKERKHVEQNVQVRAWRMHKH